MSETAAVRDLDGLRDGGRLRDMDRWRDKIEVRLDNRQVFFLFFGSAVVACMLFVLGVIVGKRIESRGRADALEVQDPLAALDRAHEPPLVAGPTAPPAELTFPKALAANAGAKASAARADKSALVAALPKPIPPAASLPKPIVPASALPKPVVPASALPKPVGVASAPKLVAAAPKPIAIAAPKPVAAPKPAALPVVDATKAKGKYTLQLSAFPTREEADAFAKKFDGTFVIPTEIPGKGTWYRVRCGNYGTYADATNAKLAFEKTNKVIALVSAR